MSMLTFEGKSTAELDALMAQMKAAKAKAKSAESARYAEKARDLIETIISELGVAESPTSPRVGRSTSNLEIEVDGKKYTFYVSVKDVAATEAREKAVEAGTLVLEKPKRGKKATEDAPEDAPEDTEAEADTEADTEATPVDLTKK
jgi:hypothetical protein